MPAGTSPANNVVAPHKKPTKKNLNKNTSQKRLQFSPTMNNGIKKSPELYKRNQNVF